MKANRDIIRVMFPGCTVALSVTMPDGSDEEYWSCTVSRSMPPVCSCGKPCQVKVASCMVALSFDNLAAELKRQRDDVVDVDQGQVR